VELIGRSVIKGLFWHLPWATEEDQEISDMIASLETKIRTCDRIWRRSGIRYKWL